MKAIVDINVAERNGISYLKKAYCTSPFKIMDITELKTEGKLNLMLMNASPGILDGDHYEMNIDIDAGVDLQIQTQAYQRIFQMKTGASQNMKVSMAANASFCYLPHPTVPHGQSSFIAINDFYLENNCRFVFGEILTCGRKLNQEVFLLSKYQSISRLFVNNKLLIKENLLMQPSLIPVAAIGQLEGFTHQASIILFHTGFQLSTIQQELVALLSAEKNIEFGISSTPLNGLIIRMLGNGAEQLFNCLQQVNQIFQQASYKKSVYAS